MTVIAVVEDAASNTPTPTLTVTLGGVELMRDAEVEGPPAEAIRHDPSRLDRDGIEVPLRASATGASVTDEASPGGTRRAYPGSSAAGRRPFRPGR